MESVWTRTAKLPSFSPLQGDTSVDILIIGGGMAGLLTAYMLQQARADYLLVEADRLAGGITKNTTAKITSQHGLIYNKLLRQFDAETARLYYDANENALQEFRKLCRDIPCDFEERDSYVYATGSRKTLDDELRTLKQLGINSEYRETRELPFPTAGAVCFPAQAQFHPLKFLAAVAQGLRIAEHTKVRAFDGDTIETEHGTIRAKRIVVATHFPMFNKHGGYFLKMHQNRSYVLELTGVPVPEGMYVDESEKGLSFRNYNGRLLLGGGSHKTGKQGGAWQELEAFAAKYYPKARVTGRWAAQDCMTLDDLPYIGQYSPAAPGLFVATGFNKWGMSSSMAAALLLRDLLQGRSNPYEELYAPSRSILRPQLLINGLSAAANLLTPTAPRCPHLGCALKWNAQEHSWDCPCHGSRFGETGELIDGPATDDLKKTPPKR